MIAQNENEDLQHKENQRAKLIRDAVKALERVAQKHGFNTISEHTLKVIGAVFLSYFKSPVSPANVRSMTNDDATIKMTTELQRATATPELFMDYVTPESLRRVAAPSLMDTASLQPSPHREKLIVSDEESLQRTHEDNVLKVIKIADAILQIRQNEGQEISSLCAYRLASGGNRYALSDSHYQKSQNLMAAQRKEKNAKVTLKIKNPPHEKS